MYFFCTNCFWVFYITGLTTRDDGTPILGDCYLGGQHELEPAPSLNLDTADPQPATVSGQLGSIE